MHTMTVLAHGVCMLTACLYQQHPPKTTADHLRDPVVTPRKRQTGGRVSRGIVTILLKKKDVNCADLPQTSKSISPTALQTEFC